jgi:hypothetical protein
MKRVKCDSVIPAKRVISFDPYATVFEIVIRQLPRMTLWVAGVDHTLQTLAVKQWSIDYPSCTISPRDLAALQKLTDQWLCIASTTAFWEGLYQHILSVLIVQDLEFAWTVIYDCGQESGLTLQHLTEALTYDRPWVLAKFMNGDQALVHSIGHPDGAFRFASQLPRECLRWVNKNREEFLSRSHVLTSPMFKFRDFHGFIPLISTIDELNALFDLAEAQSSGGEISFVSKFLRSFLSQPRPGFVAILKRILTPMSFRMTAGEQIRRHIRHTFMGRLLRKCDPRKLDIQEAWDTLVEIDALDTINFVPGRRINLGWQYYIEKEGFAGIHGEPDLGDEYLPLEYFLEHCNSGRHMVWRLFYDHLPNADQDRVVKKYWSLSNSERNTAYNLLHGPIDWTPRMKQVTKWIQKGRPK